MAKKNNNRKIIDGNYYYDKFGHQKLRKNGTMGPTALRINAEVKHGGKRLHISENEYEGLELFETKTKNEYGPAGEKAKKSRRQSVQSRRLKAQAKSYKG